jgi:hypothetical protein
VTGSIGTLRARIMITAKNCASAKCGGDQTKMIT